MKTLILLLITACTFAYPQGRSLSICDVTISIGMKASDIIASFPKNVSVSTRASLSDVTYIVQQHDPNDAGYKEIGQFKAVDGKIISIIKNCGTYTLEDFWQGLADLYYLISKAGEVKLFSHSGSDPDQHSKSRSIVFRNENTTYSLNLSEYGLSLAQSVK